METTKRKQSWNDRRKKYVPKPVTNSIVSEVNVYYLSEDELAHYRNILKPPIKENSVRTLADRDRRHVNLRNEG